MENNMKDYIKVLNDDLGKKIDDNMQDIDMLEQINIVYDGIREKLEKVLNHPDDVTDKIKEFINELEHNIQVDKSTDEILMSGVACDYVIEKLKDIIK